MDKSEKESLTSIVLLLALSDRFDLSDDVTWRMRFSLCLRNRLVAINKRRNNKHSVNYWYKSQEGYQEEYAYEMLCYVKRYQARSTLRYFLAWSLAVASAMISKEIFEVWGREAALKIHGVFIIGFF